MKLTPPTMAEGMELTSASNLGEKLRMMAYRAARRMTRGSVSYTHLDVYKRQGQGKALLRAPQAQIPGDRTREQPVGAGEHRVGAAKGHEQGQRCV